MRLKKVPSQSYQGKATQTDWQLLPSVYNCVWCLRGGHVGLSRHITGNRRPPPVERFAVLLWKVMQGVFPMRISYIINVTS